MFLRFDFRLVDRPRLTFAVAECESVHELARSSAAPLQALTPIDRTLPLVVVRRRGPMPPESREIDRASICRSTESGQSRSRPPHSRVGTERVGSGQPARPSVSSCQSGRERLSLADDPLRRIGEERRFFRVSRRAVRANSTVTRPSAGSRLERHCATVRRSPYSVTVGAIRPP